MMQIETDNIRSRYHLLFSLTWISSLMFYPVWVEPTTTQIRSFIYIVIVLWTTINIIMFSRFLFHVHIQPFPPKSLSIKLDTCFIVLISLLLVNILLHLYPISFPLVIIDDEAAHAGNALALISRFLWMKNLDPDKYFVFIRISIWIAFLISAVLFSKREELYSKVVLLYQNRKKYILFFIFLSLVSIMLFFLTKDMKFHIALMRYPPIGKILYALSISLFGINEFSVRIPQLLFTVLSSIFIYKICEDHLNSARAGLMSACFYAFSPMVFYQSALAELVCGTVFFSIVIIYFYLKYSKTDNIGFLIICFYFISLGFLYKRIIVVMLAVIVISLLLKENRIKLSLLFKLSYFCMVPIIPYIIIGKIYPNNPFGLNLSNWLKPGPAFGYFILLLYQLSYPLYVLAAISIVYLFVKKFVLRPPVSVFFICFVLYYVFFTSISIHGQGPYVYGLHRYSMILYSFIAVSVGLFIERMAGLIKWNHSFKLVSFAFISYLVLICTVWQVPPLNAHFVAYKNIESRYFPVDKAMLWIKNNIRDGRILVLRVAPATFYRDKYGVRRDTIVDIWYHLEDVATPAKLKRFYTNNKISYIMFSYRTAEEIDILKYLARYRGDEFTEVAKFRLDENYIFIYKINL